MDEAGRLQWGVREDKLRQADLAAVKAGTLTLEQAQGRARRRSRQSGMTPYQAHMALVDAQRQSRS